MTSSKAWTAWTAWAAVGALSGCATKAPEASAPNDAAPVTACSSVSAQWYFVDGGLHVMVFNQGLGNANVDRVALNSQGPVRGGWTWHATRPGALLKSGQIRVLPVGLFKDASGNSLPDCIAPVHIMIHCDAGAQSVQLAGFPSSLPPEWQKCGEEP
jgi:hypothetical protein